jgi:hypothetical protein
MDDVREYMSFVAHRITLDVNVIQERVRQIEAGSAPPDVAKQICTAVESIQRFIDDEHERHVAYAAELKQQQGG